MQFQWFEILAWLLLGGAIACVLMLATRFEKWFDEMIGELADRPGHKDDSSRY